MADHPLLFRLEMVRALLAGTKTQTRRPAWRVGRLDEEKLSPSRYPTAARRIKPGDRVWVRETHAFTGQFDADTTAELTATYGDPAHVTRDHRRYRADADAYDDSMQTWRPSIHMPRWASRLTLAVTAVRIERLQDISDEDAIAEGVRVSPVVAEYRALYERIHGAEAWDANPEVVVITFTVHKLNIDALKAAKVAA